MNVVSCANECSEFANECSEFANECSELEVKKPVKSRVSEHRKQVIKQE